MAKQRFLVAYDYGMGGRWGFLLADSEAAIRAIYPELTVAHHRPVWMTDARFEQLKRDECHDIDDPPSGLLKAVVVDRGK